MKLKGRYKGTRKRAPEKILYMIECPCGGWKSRPDADPFKVELNYIRHLMNAHKDSVEGIPPMQAIEKERTK